MPLLQEARHAERASRFIAGLAESFILRGLLFFLILTWVQTLLELPFSYYGTFVVEARHGFNTMTPRLWIIDLLKSQMIGSLLFAIMTAAAFWLIQWRPLHWWLWVWGFLALFTLFMMFISPYVIEPLFNKFEPVVEEGLEDDIKVMMARAGLQVGKVMQMDASKRSRHSNAYFTGIGKVKRIVLYDTLIKQMTHAEIVAVLAHEIGHWKKGHIRKRLLLAEAGALAGSWIVRRRPWNEVGHRGLFRGAAGQEHDRRNRQALQRGPVVYCVEGADNGGKAWNFVLPPGASFMTEPHRLSEIASRSCLFELLTGLRQPLFVLRRGARIQNRSEIAFQACGPGPVGGITRLVQCDEVTHVYIAAGLRKQAGDVTQALAVPQAGCLTAVC